MNRNKAIPSPASGKEQAEGSREKANVAPKNTAWNTPKGEPEEPLSGKTDSGPEPDVFGREIPPQD